MRTTFLCVTCAGEQQLLLESPLDLQGGGPVRHRLGPNDLEGHGDAELLVPGLVDRAHATEPEHADDVIPGTERLSRLEGAGLFRVGWCDRGARRRLSRARGRSGHPGRAPLSVGRSRRGAERCRVEWEVCAWCSG